MLDDPSGGPFKCLTGKECLEEEEYYDSNGNLCPYYYAYSATGTCVKNQPDKTSSFDTDWLDKGVYDCAGKYLDLRTFSCVGNTQCTGISGAGHRMLLSRSQGLCLGED